MAIKETGRGGRRCGLHIEFRVNIFSIWEEVVGLLWVRRVMEGGYNVYFYVVIDVLRLDV